MTVLQDIAGDRGLYAVVAKQVFQIIQKRVPYG